ncbi:hypothetical protein CAEBREN_16489 [Caenorhabditis brenneri]|uniref:Uncharacterized protein n=1 Tax=Caenorhabditis brenneri TaxID=135651 RepID=G0NQE3_CAEBE|nr:hypothetical protein CAEBREN_16489 [Caenorhabditis brenneri]
MIFPRKDSPRRHEHGRLGGRNKHAVKCNASTSSIQRTQSDCSSSAGPSSSGSTHRNRAMEEDVSDEEIEMPAGSPSTARSSIYEFESEHESDQEDVDLWGEEEESDLDSEDLRLDSDDKISSESDLFREQVERLCREFPSSTDSTIRRRMRELDRENRNILNKEAGEVRWSEPRRGWSTPPVSTEPSTSASFFSAPAAPNGGRRSGPSTSFRPRAPGTADRQKEGEHWQVTIQSCGSR